MSEDQNKKYESQAHINDERMHSYLSNELSDEQRHDMEIQMENDPFAADAAEGLMGIESEYINANVNELHYQLRKQLHKKVKKKRATFDQTTIVITFFIIMALAVVAYFLIVKLGK